MTDILLRGILFHNIYRRAFNDIQKADLISFPVCSDWIIQGDFTGAFFFWNGASSEAHYQCSRAAIGGKARGFFRIKGADRFDQTDSSDGDQVFRIFTGTLIFFYYVGDQAEVMLNQDIFAAKSPSGNAEDIIFPRLMSKVLKKSSSLHLKGDLLTAYARDRLSVLFQQKETGDKT